MKLLMTAYEVMVDVVGVMNQSFASDQRHIESFGITVDPGSWFYTITGYFSPNGTKSAEVSFGTESRLINVANYNSRTSIHREKPPLVPTYPSHGMPHLLPLFLSFL